MPYFRCPRCRVRLYSAASQVRCADCAGALGPAEHLPDESAAHRFGEIERDFASGTGRRFRAGARAPATEVHVV